ncbi:glycosyltransferase family 2 protein [Chryseobacterium sp. FH1]|uniref:glycosyltransferase family 2 protein n=1 Tax=Chryseobacterium sp. FH1 TaxID=1233951 RepID=UPI00068DBB7C|nr:glycosyltransferase family A protein [Chryseobacterium sp. FH1]
MLFSILIAHYNNYDYFKDCYYSILKQTYQNYEIILVDDCSIDDSYKKIQELTKDNPRVKTFQNESNKGVGFTKRKCIELATGEICGFVDPDDAIAENALEKSVENHMGDNVVTYSQFYLCDKHLEPQRLFQHSRAIKNNDKKFFNIFLEANHFFTFKKSAYSKTSGINQDLTSAVDQDLYLKLYDVGSFKFIKDPLYYYRLHENGVSQDSSKKEKLNQNWHHVIIDTANRRNLKKLYGKKITEINNLPEFLKRNQNNLFTKILRKFS